MDAQAVFDKLEHYGVVPVIGGLTPDIAVPLADALADGGLPVAEITFRSRGADEVIRRIREERPEVLIGAGTILNIEDLNRARDAGAAFAVAPGLNAKVAGRALEIGMPFMPGVMTPSEIEAALEMGFTRLKFFPAEAAGGLAMLKAIGAPYKHLGLRFMPTGGVDTVTVQSYLAFDQVFCVGGSWVAAGEDIKGGLWGNIAGKCHDALATVHASRRALV